MDFSSVLICFIRPFNNVPPCTKAIIRLNKAMMGPFPIIANDTKKEIICYDEDQ